jgi:hypothetical protein
MSLIFFEGFSETKPTFFSKEQFLQFVGKNLSKRNFFRQSLVQGSRLKCQRQISQTNFLLFAVFFLLKVGQQQQQQQQQHQRDQQLPQQHRQQQSVSGRSVKEMI